MLDTHTFAEKLYPRCQRRHESSVAFSPLANILDTFWPAGELDLLSKFVFICSYKKWLALILNIKCHLFQRDNEMSLSGLQMDHASGADEWWLCEYGNRRGTLNSTALWKHQGKMSYYIQNIFEIKNKGRITIWHTFRDKGKVCTVILVHGGSTSVCLCVYIRLIITCHFLFQGSVVLDPDQMQVIFPFSQYISHIIYFKLISYMSCVMFYTYLPVWAVSLLWRDRGQGKDCGNTQLPNCSIKWKYQT